jgi:hypothetical protein
MAAVNRDDWGFTAADHAELHALMSRHAHAVPELMRRLTWGDVVPDADDPRMLGMTPTPDDPGMMGLIASAMPVHEGNHVRVFPKGGLWLALLAALRFLDKGGA